MDAELKLLAQERSGTITHMPQKCLPLKLDYFGFQRQNRNGKSKIFLDKMA